MFRNHSKRIAALLLTIVMLCSMLPTAFAADVLITKQPRNASAYAGERASTTVTATGDGLTYQWYIAAEGSSKFSKSSVTKATYGCVMSETSDGRQAYCVVTDQNGNTAKSNTVTLSLRTSLAVTTQPKSVTVKSGAKATVTIAATGDGLTYAWYYKNPGATKFSKTSSFTGKTYSVAMDASRDGRQVYCVITDKYGTSVKTDTATLSMQHPVKITSQPKAAYAYEGSIARTTVKATGDGLTYTWYIASATGTKFSKSSVTASSYGAKMSAASDGRKVYCVVKDKYGNTAKSKTVTLNMAVPFSISKQPISVNVNDGETAKVSFTAKGEGLTYTWYYKNAGANSFSKTTAFKGNSYSIEMTAARAGRQVYCMVTDITGKTLQTNTVTLGMLKPIKITQQPKAAYAYEGKTAKVSVEVDRGDVTYTWYIASKGSTKFSKSSVTASSYGAKMSETSDGRQVYCVVSDAYGNSVTTDIVTLTMVAPLKITQQPESIWVNDGEKAAVTVEATGEGLTYEWYYKNAGASKFTKTTSFKGNTYSLTMDTSRDGRQVYCVITDATGSSLKTDVATLSMVPSGLYFSVSYNRASITGYNGSATKLTIPPNINGIPVTKIDRWAFHDCDTLTAVTIPNTVSYIDEYAFYDCDSLLHMVIPDSVWMIGSDAFGSCYRLRVIEIPSSVTSMGNYIFSSYGSLSYICVHPNSYAYSWCENNGFSSKITSAVIITQQPMDTTVNSGETAAVTVSARGGDLHYQWYYANKNAEEFTKSSVKTATYSVEMTSAKSGRRVYCVITDDDGCETVSNTVTLSMRTELKITTQPKDAANISGKTVSVSVAAQGDDLKYQWYIADEGSSTFAKSSITTATYSTTMDASRNGRKVYCVVTDKYGDKVTSNTVTLSMGTTLKITTQPKNVYAAKNETASVTVAAKGDGLKYQWYYLKQGATAFAKSSNTTTTYTTTMDSSCKWRDVYCVITDKYGNKVTSNTVTLGIPTTLEITKQPVSICTDIGKEITLTVQAKGDGLTYQWYYVWGGDEPEECTSKASACTITMSSFWDGCRFYCMITDAHGKTIKTDTVTLSTIPAGLKYSVADDNVIITDYTGNATYLTIPDSIDGVPVTSIGYQAFDSCKLTSITLPNSVKSIGNEAFAWCKSLTSITLGSGVKSIGTRAFYHCDSLASITIPNSVTRIGENAFYSCKSLASVTLGNGVKCIDSYAFAYCTSLISITIPKNVTSIEISAFEYCSSLMYITIPNSVTYIGSWAFNGCDLLTVKCKLNSEAHTYCVARGIDYELQ